MVFDLCALVVTALVATVLYAQKRQRMRRKADMQLVLDAPGAPPTAVDPYRAPSPVRAAPPEPGPADFASLVAEGRRREHENDPKDQREWIRLARLCDALSLLPRAPEGGEPPSAAEFPTPTNLAYHEQLRKAPPSPAEVAAASAKARAEIAWLRSLPFALEDYFIVLAAEPEAVYTLQLAVTFKQTLGMPSAADLTSAVHSHDIKANVVVLESAMVVESGRDTVDSAGQFPHTVRKIAPYVHAFVDRVLLALHRQCAIDHIRLTRS